MLPEKSPFDLIRGTDATGCDCRCSRIKPSVLVLDEPTAGLDPRGRKEIMELFNRLHEEERLNDNSCDA